MFQGNPAGVVFLDRPADSAWMQAIAAEFNQPATAFVDLSPEHHHATGLRWFSPSTELSLCGHATLASAHIIGVDRAFQAKSGLLRCTVGPSGAISMRFPQDPVCPESPPAEFLTGLPGITPRSVWRGRTDVLVEAASAAEVRALDPDVTALSNVAARAVIVTAVGDRTTDIVSRVFAPRAGIPEDPVTGPAHRTLANFWCRRLAANELLAEQASARGGLVQIRLDGDHVIISGRAVTVYSGQLHS